MTGRILSRCGRSEHSPDPEEGNGEGIESLPPSDVTAKTELIEIIHLEMRSSDLIVDKLEQQLFAPSMINFDVKISEYEKKTIIMYFNTKSNMYNFLVKPVSCYVVLI